MTGFQQWLAGRRVVHAPLFHRTAAGVATTQAGDRQVLRRHAEMEQTMVQVVTDGLRDPRWTGFVYAMCWGDAPSWRPIYIGMCGRRGTEKAINTNLEKIETRRSTGFGRWGSSRYYHIGDLSDAVLDPKNSKRQGKQKYNAWADLLFERGTRLRAPVSLLWVPLYGDEDPATVEADLIELALEDHDDTVLNVLNERWWAPGSRKPRAARPKRPFAIARDARALTGHPVLGLDTETALYGGTLRLVQVATPTQTLLFLPENGLDDLKPVLEDRAVTKVCHNASFERRALAGVGITLRGTFDTLRASRAYANQPRGGHGLAPVAARMLARRLDKGPQTSDWGRRPLTDRQLRYAALDAEVALDLYFAFQKAMPDRLFHLMVAQGQA